MGWFAPGVAAVYVGGLWERVLMGQEIGHEGIKERIPEDPGWV